MWPYACQFVEKLFRETIEPAVKGVNSHLSTFTFTKIDLGDKPLRVNGVKVYTENVDKRQIIMDLQISFAANTEIDVDIKRYYCKAGIKSIQLHGVLRVVLEPLLGEMPLVGALSLFFLKKPLVDISWTGLTNILDIPVLRIHFLEAQDLEGKDTYLGGLIKGKSDPYGVLQVGTQLFQTKTIKECLNPKWNEVFEALVYEHSGQHLEIELFDEDPDKDDFLGSLMIDLTELHKEQKVDEWFDLEEASSGKLHLRLEWLSLHSDTEKLDQALRSIRTNDSLSAALLVVYLDSARNLPVSSAALCSYPVRYKTCEPLWEEAFTFLVNNPRTQELQVEVRDAKHKCSLGGARVPLVDLLVEKDLTLTQQFPLSNSGPSSTLKLKMALRVSILYLEKETTSGLPSSVQIRRTSQCVSSPTPQPQPTASTSSTSNCTNHSHSVRTAPSPCSPSPTTPCAAPQGQRGSAGSPVRLAEAGRSSSGSALGGLTRQQQNHRDSTHSLASDTSLPSATLELQHRLTQLQNGSSQVQYPLGEVQLTIRHSSHRNKLIVVVHACRNLIAMGKDGADPYIRLYLLPDKSRGGRRKTSTVRKNQNPIYDQSFEFIVSAVELNRRSLDVAVKNGGGLLSKNKGLLGKVQTHTHTHTHTLIHTHIHSHIFLFSLSLSVFLP
uniref:Extended synaptotagmin-like protein 2b n=1 Tax=Astyanax mexicanus TaxID=7994 RepID=A0A8B9JIP9_ASTMX